MNMPYRKLIRQKKCMKKMGENKEVKNNPKNDTRLYLHGAQQHLFEMYPQLCLGNNVGQEWVTEMNL